MRLLADMHISPRTVAWLRSLGHDVVRVDEVLQPTASDEAIVDRARKEGRVVLTQDLDFSAIIAVSGHIENRRWHKRQRLAEGVDAELVEHVAR
jgi:predicted nuclease of predicted toxin-antitoxin system